MKKSTLEDFMNKQCLIVNDFDPSDDEIDENSDDTDDEEARQVLEDYDQTFMIYIYSDLLMVLLHFLISSKSYVT